MPSDPSSTGGAAGRTFSRFQPRACFGETRVVDPGARTPGSRVGTYRADRARGLTQVRLPIYRGFKNDRSRVHDRPCPAQCRTRAASSVTQKRVESAGPNFRNCCLPPLEKKNNKRVTVKSSRTVFASA